jgi:pimeloyl-ACP methyl ester carboxylesterase
MTNNKNLNYKAFRPQTPPSSGGEGECGTIIILHGLLGALDNWQTIAKELSKNYPVYIIDQRNHGRSLHTNDMDYKLFADDLNDFIMVHQLKNVVLIGHSMGGKTAMLFTLLHPESVDKLIVVDIAPKLYSGGHEHILNVMQNLPLAVMKTRKEIEDFLEKDITNAAELGLITKNLGRNADNTFYWKCNLDAIVKNYSVLMDFPAVSESFEGKVYFIKGALSEYIEDKDRELCRKYFPDAKFYTIRNAAHWVHADNTKDFLDIIEQILEKDKK